MNVVSYKCQQAVWKLLPVPLAALGGLFPLAASAKSASDSSGPCHSPLTDAREPWAGDLSLQPEP